MSEVITYQKFWQRRDTEANWAAVNPILNAGEFGVVIDGASGQPIAHKLGNGTSAWMSLPYSNDFAGVASGTNTLTCTFDPTPVLYDQMLVRLRAAGANTGAVTFNTNGLGAVNVKKFGGTALVTGDIFGAGHELILVYRSSVPCWELLNPTSGSVGGYQPLDATLTTLAAANWAANALPIGSGADTLTQVAFAVNTFPARASTGNLVAKPITDFGLSLVDDADATAARATLGLGTYLHTQAVAASTWTINHNLGFNPNISLRSVGGVEFDATVTHTSANQTVVTLASDLVGTARLN